MQDRTRLILEDLEAVRENLLALSDDIWLSIDHNDSDALEEGVEFKRQYNQKMAAFDTLASELSEMVQKFTSITLGSEEQTGLDDQVRNERIIRELDREEPHSLDEDFTFKRPHGYILDGQAATGITTWRRLFELVCLQLARNDPQRFDSLPDNADFISNRGHRNFARSPGELRSASSITNGIHAEVNLSANGLRDTIARLLKTFDIPADRLRLFLRQDRDAERNSDGTQ